MPPVPLSAGTPHQAGNITCRKFTLPHSVIPHTILLLIALVVLAPSVGAIRVAHYDYTFPTSPTGSARLQTNSSGLYPAVDVAMCRYPPRSTPWQPLRSCANYTDVNVTLSHANSAKVPVPLDCDHVMGLVVVSRQTTPVHIVDEATGYASTDLFISCGKVYPEDPTPTDGERNVILHGLGLVTYRWVELGEHINETSAAATILRVLQYNKTGVYAINGPAYARFIGCEVNAAVEVEGSGFFMQTQRSTAGIGSIDPKSIGVLSGEVFMPATSYAVYFRGRYDGIPCTILTRTAPSSDANLATIPYYPPHPRVGVTAIAGCRNTTGGISQYPTMTGTRFGTRQYVSISVPLGDALYSHARGQMAGWDDELVGKCVIVMGGLPGAHHHLGNIPLTLTTNLDDWATQGSGLISHFTGASYYVNSPTVSGMNEIRYHQHMPWAAHLGLNATSIVGHITPTYTFAYNPPSGPLELLTYDTSGATCSPCLDNQVGMPDAVDTHATLPDTPQWVLDTLDCLPHLTINGPCIIDANCGVSSHASSLGAVAKCNVLMGQCVSTSRTNDVLIAQCIADVLNNATQSPSHSALSLLAPYETTIGAANETTAIQCLSASIRHLGAAFPTILHMLTPSLGYCDAIRFHKVPIPTDPIGVAYSRGGMYNYSYVTWKGQVPYHVNQNQSQCYTNSLYDTTQYPLSSDLTPTTETTGGYTWPTIDASAYDCYTLYPAATIQYVVSVDDPLFEEWQQLAAWGRTGADELVVDWVGLLVSVLAPMDQDVATAYADFMETTYSPHNAFDHVASECTGLSDIDHSTNSLHTDFIIPTNISTWIRWIGSGPAIPGQPDHWYNFSVTSHYPYSVFAYAATASDGTPLTVLIVHLDGRTARYITIVGDDGTVHVNGTEATVVLGSILSGMDPTNATTCPPCYGARPEGATCANGIYLYPNGSVAEALLPTVPPTPVTTPEPSPIPSPISTPIPSPTTLPSPVPPPPTSLNQTITVPTIVIGNVTATNVTIAANATITIIGSLTIEANSTTILDQGSAINVTGNLVLGSGATIVIKGGKANITAGCLYGNDDHSPSIVLLNESVVTITTECTDSDPTISYQGEPGPCGDDPSITKDKQDAHRGTQLTVVASFDDECGNLLESADSPEALLIIIVTCSVAGVIVLGAVIAAVVFRKVIFPHRHRQQYVSSRNLMPPRDTPPGTPPSSAGSVSENKSGSTHGAPKTPEVAVPPPIPPPFVPTVVIPQPRVPYGGR